MAKKENAQSESEIQEQQPEAVQAETANEPIPSAEPAPLMPVEKQAEVHKLAHDPNRALDPGRPFAAGEGLLGEIALLIHKADEAGDAALVGELQSLEIKIGDLLSHINDVEEKAKDHVKPLYLKLVSFFRK